MAVQIARSVSDFSREGVNMPVNTVETVGANRDSVEKYDADLLDQSIASPNIEN